MAGYQRKTALTPKEVLEKADQFIVNEGEITGVSLVSNPDFYDEEKLFSELLAEYPEREEFALGLALASKFLGNEERHGKLMKAAADLYPAEARYYYEFGAVAEEGGDLSGAAVFYRRALEKAFKTVARR